MPPLTTDQHQSTTASAVGTRLTSVAAGGANGGWPSWGLPRGPQPSRWRTWRPTIASWRGSTSAFRPLPASSPTMPSRRSSPPLTNVPTTTEPMSFAVAVEATSSKVLKFSHWVASCIPRIKHRTIKLLCQEDYFHAKICELHHKLMRRGSFSQQTHPQRATLIARSFTYYQMKSETPINQPNYTHISKTLLIFVMTP